MISLPPLLGGVQAREICVALSTVADRPVGASGTVAVWASAGETVAIRAATTTARTKRTLRADPLVKRVKPDIGLPAFAFGGEGGHSSAGVTRGPQDTVLQAKRFEVGVSARNPFLRVCVQGFKASIRECSDFRISIRITLHLYRKIRHSETVKILFSSTTNIPRRGYDSQKHPQIRHFIRCFGGNLLPKKSLYLNTLTI